MFDKRSGKAPTISAAKALANVDKARTELEAAQRSYEIAIFDTANGEDPAAETKAEARVAECTRGVRRAEVIHAEALKAESKADAATRLAAEVVLDRSIRVKLDRQLETSKALAKALAVYDAAFAEHHQAEQDVKGALPHPRVRSDLQLLPWARERVALELTRLSGHRTEIPPGANVMAKHMGDPNLITPLVDQVAQDNAAIAQGLHK